MSASKYVQDDGPSDEPASKVCSEAGRRCVKNIRQYPILSADWIGLVDYFKQLTRLVLVEGRMTPNTKVAENQGRNADGGTLWDQEAHENAIRILVEEAKVNLCLRIMHDFKKWQYDEALKNQTIQECSQKLGYPEVHLNQILVDFEGALGMLMARAFMHVETLQLMDIPLMIEHIEMVLRHGLEVGTPSGGRMQETIGLYYFASLMKFAEALNNSELLAKSRELRIIHLSTAQVLKVLPEVNADLILNVAEGFAALCDNEDFNSAWQDYFIGLDGQLDAEAKSNFMQLEDKVAGAIIASNPEKKKDLRPLLDFCSKTLKR